MDPDLIAIVILVESGGDPLAVSPAGARGLMQVMPSTADDIAKALKISGHTPGALADPGYNIHFGSYYLAKQLRRFWNGEPAGSIERAAGAYNGGPARMQRHLSRGEGLPGETMRYKRWVAGMWRERGYRSSVMYADWLRSGGRRLVARVNPPSGR